MPDTIHNPTADQLEAGGSISGTYWGLHFVDEVLVETVADGLVVGYGVVVRFGRDTLGNNLTIHTYTPPEPKPWWETCDDDTLISAKVVAGSSNVARWTYPAGWWRHMKFILAERDPRRVLIADADTEVIVPKAAVERLRERQVDICNSPVMNTAERKNGYSAAITHFLAAVDEAGGA